LVLNKKKGFSWNAFQTTNLICLLVLLYFNGPTNQVKFKIKATISFFKFFLWYFLFFFVIFMFFYGCLLPIQFWRWYVLEGFLLTQKKKVFKIFYLLIKMSLFLLTKWGISFYIPEACWCWYLTNCVLPWSGDVCNCRWTITRVR
jgi:hypothetical protein